MENRIQVLDAHVADLIAAGEVVERPASVVKELVENAIDAGSTAVTIEIQRGGMSLIRVADNGKGIPSDECETAFLRHATSKLREPEDLAAIGTLGFRGEALAAIAAVARVELFTRTKEDELGTTLTLEGGDILAHDQAGCPLGTTLVVRDLFFNTPARLKFMKRDTAEGAAVFAVVQRLALSHPEVSIKFLRDGKQDLLTPGDGKLQSALYAVLGRDLALGFTAVEGQGEDVAVTGFVSLPACCRGSRSYQHFFVNGRQVKSKLLTAALERAYENQKMVGKFPGCVLQLQVKANEVDVNVHPAKTEVKFLYERKVFDGVYYSVLSALGGEQRRPAVEFKPMESAKTTAPLWSPTLSKPTAGFTRMTAEEFRKTTPKSDTAALLRPMAREETDLPYTPELSPKVEKKPDFTPRIVDDSVEIVEKPSLFSEKTGKVEAVPKKPSAPSAPVQPEPELPWRLVGEVLNTYVIVEQGDQVLLIDKHAAHERLNFDRMKAEDYVPMSQTLLAPVVFTPSPEEEAALLANLPLLTRYGFECESFGGGSIAVRALPDYLDPGQAEGALCELADALLSGTSTDPEAARDAVLHTMACKAAVKGGQKNTREELMVVAKAVVDRQVKYCPHGRPVAITMTKQELEKQFKRA